MDVLENLQKLPRCCATAHPETGKPILIIRGEPGYYDQNPNLDVDAFNRRRGITEAQVKAMEHGSAFGWHVPAASPDLWEAELVLMQANKALEGVRVLSPEVVAAVELRERAQDRVNGVRQSLGLS